MHLSDHVIRPSVAVSDMSQARAFYEDRLGLPVLEEDKDGSRIYACGLGTSLHVYPSADSAGQAPATVATWTVPDVASVVGELQSNGVTFEQYDEPPLRTDARGIFTDGDTTVAWFKDPDGNTFAVEQQQR